MKAKITKQGCLQIERAGKMKRTLCPYEQTSDTLANCGDWCALFGEPVYPESVHDYIMLQLCQGKILYLEHDGFVDERSNT